MLLYERSQIMFILKQMIAELLEQPNLIDDLSHEANLQDYGVDSILTMNLIVLAEQKFKVTFEDEELLLEGLSTVNQLADHIQDKLGSRLA